MSIIKRKYNPDVDLDRILDFLCETYFETKIISNYFPDRFENDKDNYTEGICLWEEVNETNQPEKGKIVGVSTPERKFVYFIQIHPKYQYLLQEIVDWIVRHSKNIREKPNESQDLFIICLDGNIKLEEVLRKKGFERHSNYGYLRFREINKPIHSYIIPEGFSVRSSKGKKDHRMYTQAIRDTFGHGEWFDANLVEKLNSNSYYNPDLDLIVEAPNGEVAAFCTFRMDPKSRITQLEPLGTTPKYRKLGLAKTILGEGFKKLKTCNPSLLYIGGAVDTPEANNLYDSTGFTNKTMLYSWKKQI
jgi:predicted N-acetyltransferase YhbS